MTRVRSACSASTCRSNISFTWSSQPSGTLDGRSRSTRRSPLAFCCSARWMRRSTSRTVSRYWLDLQPIAGAELPLQAGHVVDDPVEDAGVLLQLRAPLGRRAAVAEQALEDHTRIGLGRQRRRRRRPRRALFMVRAGVAVVAVADLRDRGRRRAPATEWACRARSRWRRSDRRWCRARSRCPRSASRARS